MWTFCVKSSAAVKYKRNTFFAEWKLNAECIFHQVSMEARTREQNISTRFANWQILLLPLATRMFFQRRKRHKGVRCLFWNIEKRGIWQQFRASSMSNCSCARVIYYHFTVDSPVRCSGSDKSNFLFTARRLAHFFRRATRWAVVNLLVHEFFP